MTVESADLSGELVLKQRDEVVADYLEDIQVRTGSTVAITPKTQPWIDAQVTADVVAPLYGNCQVIADGTNVRTARGKRLEAIVTQRGLPGRFPAAGSTGYVEIVANAGGTTIVVGDELVDQTNTVRFECAETATYASGAGVPVIATTPGPTSNLPAGATLKWVSPRPGCGRNALVKESSGGKGLTGGREIESDDEMIRRFEADSANGANSGNDAEYQRRTQETPNIPIAKAFTIPGAMGTSSTAIVFTVRPNRPGGGRCPTSGQIVAAEGHVVGLEPVDDSAYFAALLQSLITVALEVEWLPTAPGWVDFTPWPSFAQGMVVDAVTSATEFSVNGSGTAPTVGKTIGLYDIETGTFARKRILTVTGSGPWALTIETANNASDTSYQPTIGQRVCPWSDSLDLLVPSVTGYMETLGPGEMFATFYDDGPRGRRSPPPPAYPSTIQNRLLEPVFGVSAVKDVSLLAPTVPYATPVGTPGVSAYLLELGDFVAFAG